MILDQMIAHAVRIERECFDEPWDEGFYRWILANRHARIMVITPRTCGARIPVGFVVFARYPKRQKTCVMSVAVLPEHRHCGLGRKLIGAIPSQPGDWVHAWVREDNLTAQLFFRSLGFGAVLEKGRTGETIGMEFTRYCDPEVYSGHTAAHAHV